MTDARLEALLAEARAANEEEGLTVQPEDMAYVQHLFKTTIPVEKTA